MNENKMFCDRCNKEINNPFIYISEIDHQYLCDNCFEKEQPKALAKQIDLLKQQLAEKDKEIELYYNFLCNIADLIKTDVETLLFTNGNIITQNQTQLAIQELENVRKLLLEESKTYPIVYDITDDLVGGAIDKDKIFEIIDNQIKELKGEKDEQI